MYSVKCPSLLCDQCLLLNASSHLLGTLGFLSSATGLLLGALCLLLSAPGLLVSALGLQLSDQVFY